MKGRANGFISGVLFTLVFVSLISTAFATKGRVAVNVDYNDIRVTLDGEAVALVDANGNAVEPFAINGTTYLPVRAVANALGLEVGWDQETATVLLNTEAPKPQRNGFNTTTNQNVKLGSQVISVPNYFIQTDDSSEKAISFLDKEETTLLMIINSEIFAGNDDEVSLSTLLSYDDTVRKVLFSRFDDCVVSQEKIIQGNNVKGVQWDFSGIDTDIGTINGKLFCAPIVETDNFFSVFLFVTEGYNFPIQFFGRSKIEQLHCKRRCCECLKSQYLQGLQPCTRDYQETMSLPGSRTRYSIKRSIWRTMLTKWASRTSSTSPMTAIPA